MNVDPTRASPMQMPAFNERNNLRVGNGRGFNHQFVLSKQLLAAAPVPDKQFTVDQIVSGDFIETNQPTQLLHERRAVREGPNPYRGVHQDHYATWCFTAGFSRRLGTS